MGADFRGAIEAGSSDERGTGRSGGAGAHHPGGVPEGEETLSLAALAEKTGFYKSTILRLAASLERFGYLAREPGGLYRLGPSLWRLGSLYRRSFDLGEHLRPELRRLVEATTETASFYVREERAGMPLPPQLAAPDTASSG